MTLGEAIRDYADRLALAEASGEDPAELDDDALRAALGAPKAWDGAMIDRTHALLRPWRAKGTRTVCGLDADDETGIRWLDIYSRWPGVVDCEDCIRALRDDDRYAIAVMGASSE